MGFLEEIGLRTSERPFIIEEATWAKICIEHMWTVKNLACLDTCWGYWERKGAQS